MHHEKKVFVIQNQLQHYLDKQGNWCESLESRQLLRYPHHDVALNTLIELNARDITLRCKVLEVNLDPRDSILPDDATPATEND